jgi:hypothetical protein
MGLFEMRPGAGGGDGVADRVGVVAVDLLDVPAGGAKALDLVVGDREAGRAVDQIELLSQKAMRWPSLKWPAMEIASGLIPSIGQPSPMKTQVQCLHRSFWP